ncbi:hypothetical protein [Rhodococcus opacus]|uniref:hypothetical protein n=1 Tax=Rhodococcus opacus TaxID=37919 RepID=UPI001F55ECA3|nr:hypothetical protein [Rhodococcus opacus]UNN05171.1 hypothetical protein MOO23_40380 [Rhodococcus opacus]
MGLSSGGHSGVIVEDSGQRRQQLVGAIFDVIEKVCDLALVLVGVAAGLDSAFCFVSDLLTVVETAAAEFDASLE